MSKKIDRAGVIPYIVEEGQIKLMFMKPSLPMFGGPEFQIAKGHVEKGEDNLTAALREGKEELGLFEGNVEAVHELGTFMGRTTLFVAKIKDKDLFGDPCLETKSVSWMTPTMFEEFGRDLHKPVVKAAVRLIASIENKNQLNEIELVDESPPENIDNYTDEQEVGKSEHPLTVWKSVNKQDPRLIMFSLKNPQGAYLSHVCGHFDDNFFVAQKAWTDPSYRRKGYISALYKTLYDKLLIKIASDTQQTPAMRAVWNSLPLPVKVFDSQTKQILDRKEISDDQLYDGTGRYRLILENGWQPGDIGIPGVGATALHEYVIFTQPDRLIKVI
jgi:ADP-ribose pyrophosphatase YjhB (NUDIX family)